MNPCIAISFVPFSDLLVCVLSAIYICVGHTNTHVNGGAFARTVCHEWWKPRLWLVLFLYLILFLLYGFAAFGCRSVLLMLLFWSLLSWTPTKQAILHARGIRKHARQKQQQAESEGGFWNRYGLNTSQRKTEGMSKRPTTLVKKDSPSKG